MHLKSGSVGRISEVSTVKEISVIMCICPCLHEGDTKVRTTVDPFSGVVDWVGSVVGGRGRVCASRSLTVGGKGRGPGESPWSYDGQRGPDDTENLLSRTDKNREESDYYEGLWVSRISEITPVLRPRDRAHEDYNPSSFYKFDQFLL